MSGKNTENQSKQKKKGDILLTLVLIVAIAVFCYAAVNLFHIYTEYKKGTDEYNHIEQMAVTDRAPDSQEVAGPNAQPKAPIDVDFDQVCDFSTVAESGSCFYCERRMLQWIFFTVHR